MTIVEVILTIVGICGNFREDLFLDILMYLAIAVCVYTTIWIFVAYKKVIYTFSLRMYNKLIIILLFHPHRLHRTYY